MDGSPSPSRNDSGVFPPSLSQPPISQLSLPIYIQPLGSVLLLLVSAIFSLTAPIRSFLAEKSFISHFSDDHFKPRQCSGEVSFPRFRAELAVPISDFNLRSCLWFLLPSDPPNSGGDKPRRTSLSDLLMQMQLISM